MESCDIHSQSILLKLKRLMGNIQRDNSSPSNDNDDTCAQNFCSLFLMNCAQNVRMSCQNHSYCHPHKCTHTHAYTETRTQCHRKWNKEERNEWNIEILVFGWDSVQSLRSINFVNSWMCCSLATQFIYTHAHCFYVPRYSLSVTHWSKSMF